MYEIYLHTPNINFDLALSNINLYYNEEFGLNGGMII